MARMKWHMQQPTLSELRLGALVIAFVCKTIIFSMGVCLILPMNTFGASPKGYGVLISSGIPEGVWGAYGLLLGAVGLWSLRPDAPVALRVGCGVAGGVTFVGLSLVFLAANWSALIAWVLIPLAVLDFFSLPYLGMKA